MSERRVLLLALALLLTSSISAPTFAAPAKSRASEIAEAKASLVESADEAFVAFWPTRQTQAAQIGVSATTTRRMTRWMMAAYSLGACKRHLAPSDMADWITSADQLFLSVSEDPLGFVQGIRDEAAKLMAQGENDETFLAMPPEKLKQYCSIELAAVREYLREL